MNNRKTIALVLAVVFLLCGCANYTGGGRVSPSWRLL